MKIKKIKVPLYRVNFWIVIAKDFDLANKHYKIDLEAPPLDHGQSATSYLDHGKHLVMVIVRENYRDDPGVIAHEASHLTDYVFEMRNILHDLSNDEPYAYLLEWFMDEMWKFCSQKRAKKKDIK